MTKLFLVRVVCLALLYGSLPVPSKAQATNQPKYAFSGNAAVVSKYVWRGLRLTNDWSLQPSMTVGVNGFSFNVWGTLDLAAVNQGDALFLPGNPAAPGGKTHSGLKGKFSEADYTFSYADTFKRATIDVGTIIYTFPERQAALPATTELYGRITSSSVLLAPSAALYVDVDESRSGGGTTSVYFVLGAGHLFAFNHPVFTGLDLSTSLSFVNKGFAGLYYRTQESGVHDGAVSAGLPIKINDRWSARAFVAYSGLIRGFRDRQYQDLRAVYQGTAGRPNDTADTVFGGFSVSLSF